MLLMEVEWRSVFNEDANVTRHSLMITNISFDIYESSIWEDHKDDAASFFEPDSGGEVIICGDGALDSAKERMEDYFDVFFTENHYQ